MALYLGQSDLDAMFARGLVTPRDCVDAVRRSWHEQGKAAVGVLPRHVLWANDADQTPRSRALKLSAAYMRGSSVMGASIYATHFQPGSLDMWLTVFSGVSGKMIGVINSKTLSVWKTAATAAVAADSLARADARHAALIGTGSYAMMQLVFLQAVRPLRSVRCYSRSADALRLFCDAASSQLGLPVMPAASVCEAVTDADVVTTITTSPTPVLEGAWLPAGVHCNVMGQHAPGAREVDTRAVVDSHVVVDAMAQAMNEKGELLIPLAEGAIGREHIRAELGAVVAGRERGRTDAAQKTMFCSGGTAFEYMGLCAMLLERAAQAGIGLTLPP